MRKVALLVLLSWCINLPAQTDVAIHFQPILFGEKIDLGKAENDSFAVNTLRFYLSNFVFLKNGAVVYSEKNSHHLLDIEDEKSMLLEFGLPEKTEFDSIHFDLGVDSVTTVSGAMGGDLDPTKGMFWAWQSGYINFKIEGFSRKSPARDGEFQFHLGGYLPPFQTLQTVRLPVFPKEKTIVRLDLTPFFEKINWAKKSGIMSPCAEAVEFSRIISKSFSTHVE